MHRAALLLVVASACHASAPTEDPNVGAPTLVAQPVDKAVSPGQAATFLVRASGTGTLWYQWERNGVPIEAATLPVYATEPTALADDGATYDVVVKSAFGEVKSRAAKLSVHAGGPKTLTLHTTDGIGDAPFVAFQDGDGPWQSVDPDPHGDHAFTVTDERFGVAVADPVAASVYVFQGTVAEVEDLHLPPEFPGGPHHRVVATFVGIGADRAYIAGCQGWVAAPAGVLSCDLPSGPNDLVAVEDTEFVATAILVRRGVWVFDTGASNLGLFDFGSPRTFAPEAHILTLHGLPASRYVATEAGFRVRAGAEVLNHSFGGQFQSPDANGDLFVPMRLVPSADLAPGDVQFASIRAEGKVSDISYSEWFADAADRTMELPSSFASSVSLASASPYPRVRVDWDNRGSLLLHTLTATSDGMQWTCALSRGWLGGTPSAHYVFPDFGSVGGWSPGFALSAGNVGVAFRGDSYVDVTRSLVFAIYNKEVAPPRGDKTLSVASVRNGVVTLHVP